MLNIREHLTTACLWVHTCLCKDYGLLFLCVTSSPLWFLKLHLTTAFVLPESVIFFIVLNGKVLKKRRTICFMS